MIKPPYYVYAIESTLLLLILANVSWTEDSDNLFIVVSNYNNNSTSNDSNLTSYSRSDVCECDVTLGSETYLRFVDEDSRVDMCVNGGISFLDVCNAALQRNYNITLTIKNDVGGPYSSMTELCRHMEQARTYLFRFEAILDQTLVCVYIESCKNKTECLVSCITLIIPGLWPANGVLVLCALQVYLGC